MRSGPGCAGGCCCCCWGGGGGSRLHSRGLGQGLADGDADRGRRRGEDDERLVLEVGERGLDVVDGRRRRRVRGRSRCCCYGSAKPIGGLRGAVLAAAAAAAAAASDAGERGLSRARGESGCSGDRRGRASATRRSKKSSPRHRWRRCLHLLALLVPSYERIRRQTLRLQREHVEVFCDVGSARLEDRQQMESEGPKQFGIAFSFS